MISALNKLPGHTLEITIIVPWANIKSIYDQKKADLLKQVEIPGFRKGKAPKDLAEKQIKKSEIFQEVLKIIVPEYYAKALSEQKIKPILSPSIEVISAEEGKPWKFKAQTCESPIINLKNYRKVAQKVRSKSNQVWTPDKTDAKKDQEPSLSDLLDALYDEIEVDLPELLVTREVDRLLSNTFNELQKLGMTVENYLQSQGKTQEQLKQEYRQQAKKTLSLEFALEKIADEEKVTVEQSEIEEVIKKTKDKKEQAALQGQKYYISSILRRQKTLQKLLKPSIITPS